MPYKVSYLLTGKMIVREFKSEQEAQIWVTTRPDRDRREYLIEPAPHKRDPEAVRRTIARMAAALQNRTKK